MAIPSPVPNVNTCVQYGLLAFMSVVFGPIAGALMGLIGHAPIDFSYAVALALRHIPDIQREYRDISLFQQARGTEMSKKASLVNRLKAASTILIPLILFSMDRIETISNAMELRGFGKSGKRTWYSGKKFSKMAILCIILCVALMALSLLITFLNGSRYYNPFI